MNRLHPATMIVAFLPKLWDAFKSLLPFLAVSLFSSKGDRTEMFIALIGVFGGFGAIATYLTTRYGVQDGQLVCTSGWLFKRDRRIPLDKIQNVNLRQGFLERLLKVVTLEVETAASSGAELKLQVVTEEAANALREELALDSVKKAEIEAEAPRTDVIYRMDRRELLLGAMTENNGSQVIFAVMGTVGAAAFVQVSFRFMQLKDYVPGWLLWVIAIFAILVIMGLGWIYGGLQYAMKYAYFTVKSEPGMFRITHGLVTKLQYAVRLRRVEMATVSSTIWQRSVKCCTVRVGTAGSFGEQGTTVPIALMLPQDQVAGTLASVLPQMKDNDLEWKKMPLYYLWVRLFRVFVAWAIPIATMGLFFRVFMGLPGFRKSFDLIFHDIKWVPFAVGGIILWILIDQFIGYRWAGYAISDQVLAVREGFFRRNTIYMPIAKIDTVGTAAPTWWQRRGLTSLIANAMAHHLPITMLPESDAERVRKLIVAR